MFHTFVLLDLFTSNVLFAKLSSNRQIQLNLNLDSLILDSSHPPPPTHPPDRDSSDPAGIQQNMLYNISRYDPKELKTVFKKLRLSSKYFVVKIFFQPTWKCSDPAGIQQNMLYNISRYDPRELKTVFHKLRSSSK